MKKITLIIAGIALLVNSSIAQKAFEKGNITIDLGIGLGIFNTKSHTEQDIKVWRSGSWVTMREVKDTTDKAASMIVPLKFEYGVKSWLGVGARLAYSNYLGGKDSITGKKDKVRGLDGGVILNFHLIKTAKFDMPIGVTIGYSNFKYMSNDSLDTQAKDNGLNYGIFLSPRFYFGQHIGLFFDLGYIGYNYPSVLFRNRTDANTNDNNNLLQKIKFGGTNIGIGLVVKI